MLLTWVFDRGLADRQAPGDLAIAAAGSDFAQHFGLALSQAIGQSRHSPAR
jgi:hypothetical protein